MDIRLSCQCGQLQGEIKGLSPAAINHVICYCKFCQAYAHRFPEPESLLDAQGGSEMIQPSPATITLTQGVDQLACVKQTEKGALRYYARCCHTPLFNTPQNSKVPFVSVLVSAMPELNKDQKSEVLGPIRMHASVPDELKTQIPEATSTHNVIGLLRFIGLLFGWFVRGDARHSPLWRMDGKPLVEPVKIKRDDVL